MKNKFLILLFLISSFCTNVSAQNFEWVKDVDFGVLDIKTDDEGNIYMMGIVNWAVDIDPGVNSIIIGPTTDRDGYILKLDSMGNFLWVKQVGGTGTVSFNSFDFDSFGNVIIHGRFAAMCDLDPGSGVVNYTAVGNSDLFILRLDSNGNYINSFVISGLGTEHSYEIEVSNSDHIYVTGRHNDSIDFDPSASSYKVASLGYYDIYLAKYTLSGSLKWAHSFGSIATEHYPKLAVDTAENVTITGTFPLSLDADPGPGVWTLNPSASGHGNFLISLDSLGNLNWGYSIEHNTNNTTIFDQFESDNFGNFYGVGAYQGGVYFDPVFNSSQSVSTGSTDGFIAKYNSLCHLEWVYLLNGTGSSVISDIYFQNDKIFCIGTFTSNQIFNPNDTIVTYAPRAIFVLCLTLDGQYLWSKSIISPEQVAGECIAVINNKDVIIKGLYSGLTEFNPDGVSTTLYSPSLRNFISKYNFDPCYFINMDIDTVLNISCSQSGMVAIHANGGTSPYNFSWNTNPVTIDSICYFTNPGIYSYTITDSINCQLTGSILINEPGALTGYDLNIDLSANGFRTGSGSDISLIVFNDGCNPISGTYSLILDSLVSFNYSTPTPDQISGDTLFWNFTDIIYDSTHTVSIINVTTNGQIGDTICFTAIVNPISGDADSSNNYKNYCFPVINGYDPNDKQVYPQGECIPNYVLNGEPLTYTVRFQNTGNADAINIHILDTLDADLDLNSLRVIGNSHYLITEILPGNVMKFRFDNIHLPDSGTNELLSHGYVIYEVKPLTGTPDFTLIENTSHIYFDFNPAIVTNTTGNTLVDSIPTYSSVENISVCYNSDYIFPDGTILTDIIDSTSHQSNLWMVDGCDSIITTNISVLSPVDTAISLNNLTITANASGLNYQWLNCSTGLPLGITTQSFTPSTNGIYSVVINDGNCSDTSNCITINTIGIKENQISGLSIYPNPAKDILIIQQNSNSKLIIEIMNIEGRLIQSFTSSEKNIQTDVSEFADGMYFINVKSETGNAVYKLVKE